MMPYKATPFLNSRFKILKLIKILTLQFYLNRPPKKTTGSKTTVQDNGVHNLTVNNFVGAPNGDIN